MTTGVQDWKLKWQNRGEDLWIYVYDYLTGQPVKVPKANMEYYLSKTTKSIRVVEGSVQEYGEGFHPFVRTKEECIGSVVSSDTATVAPSGKANGKRRKRGKRGKRR